MSFEFRVNPNLKKEINTAVQDTLSRLKGSDFEITTSLHAVFVCDSNVVVVTFVMDGTKAEHRFSFTRSQADDLGQRITETGTWDEFPFSGISVEALKNFGRRLRDYGKSGC
jgi:hypothetical protein